MLLWGLDHDLSYSSRFRWGRLLFLFLWSWSWVLGFLRFVLLLFKMVLLRLRVLVQARLVLDLGPVQALVGAARAERLLVLEMELRRVLELGRQRRQRR
jgi:hypothetical protein